MNHKFLQRSWSQWVSTPPTQKSSEWVLLDANADDEYLSPEEDDKVIVNESFKTEITKISFGNPDKDVKTTTEIIENSNNDLFPEEDDKLKFKGNEIENELFKTEISYENLDTNVKTSDDEIANKILESLMDDTQDHSITKDILYKSKIVNPLTNITINATKEIVKKVPKSVWINVVLHLLKHTSNSYDWRISLTCSLASTTILIIRNRAIILNLTKFTLYNGIPFILGKTSSLKSYYFKKT